MHTIFGHRGAGFDDDVTHCDGERKNPTPAQNRTGKARDEAFDATRIIASSFSIMWFFCVCVCMCVRITTAEQKRSKNR